ncbi:beta-ketoacyl synthase N-terminal-like domain-containing protein [Streptomyces sp. NPDC001941]|uniref:type I polyketide synthase n=1 Tax=Streptomyces sp. NPDC001941 TaxID=3154659 RepID=UPI00331F309F
MTQQSQHEQAPAARTAEPIAVVGIGCRFPGGIDTPAAYWEFLVAGREAVGDIPEERWAAYPPAALRGAPRRGAFLDDAAAFDAEFFGVTPREAELIDPQQRLALEAGWEALEDAGISPHALAGSDAGVFMGVGSDDYGRQMLEDLPAVEAWSGIGASLCAVANRLSYVLDLRGPSLVVDTACSSSLAALHLACQSLRGGECGVALAGGVQLVAGPGLSLVLDAAGATSPDGRSKSFDASADGYGRGEGVGVLVLKRLADAVRDGDPVRAVIRGSALRQDGRTNGIMAPSDAAQEQVVRAALAQAGVAPATVGFVEAHGTGTRLGDPVEVSALARVFGAGRPPGEPCLIGSAKANIGHLEAGAGVAGVIKAVLALEHGVIPPTANVTELNPLVDWAASGLDVPVAPVPWPAAHPVRRAGVSGFGYGGTVGHVVLEQAPERPARHHAPAGGPHLLTVSGASPDDVRAQAAALAGHLDEHPDTELADVAHTLFARRGHGTYRGAAVADDARDAVAALRALAEDESSPAAVTGRVLPDAGPGPVWLFSGHGSQWEGMGRELLAQEPAFAAVVDLVEPVFRAELGISPREVIDRGPLTATDVVQPMIFVVQAGLDAVLRSRGLRPAAVIGHSVGEIAAAVSAGALGLADAARLICRRSRLLRRVVGDGAMAMVALPFATVEEQLDGLDGVVAAIAASPLSTVVSGAPDAVDAACARFAAADAMVRRVASDVAFHSPQMDPLTDELAAAFEGLELHSPEVPLYSTALADPRSDVPRDGRYWAANLRNPVRLDAAVAAAREDGHRVFLELSGHPVVTYSVGECAPDALALGTLRRERPERLSLLAALGALHCHGVAPELALPDAELTALPRRAWQHARYWRTSSAPGPGFAGHDPESGTLLGAELSPAGAPSPRLWRTRLDRASRPYPGSHPIHGVEVVPAAALVHTFLAAAGRDELTDVRLRMPVAITGEHEVHVVRRDDELTLASRRLDADGDTAWTTHTSAVLGRALAPAERPPVSVLSALDTGAVGERLRAVGVADVGYPWEIASLARDRGRLVSRVRHATGRASLLDAVFSIVPLAFPDDGALRMPTAVEGVRVPEELPDTVTVHVHLGEDGSSDVLLTDAEGKVLGGLGGLRFATLDGAADPAVPPHRLAHALRWLPVEPAADARARLRAVALVGEAPEDLAGALRGAGLRVLSAPEPGDLDELVDELGQGDAVVVLPAATAHTSAWRLAATAQLLLRACGSLPPRLWALTRGAWAADGPGAVAQGALWGTVRVIAGEHPELHARAVDLDADADPALLPVLLKSAPEQDGYRLGAGGTRAARLVPLAEGAPGEEAPGEPLVCRADRTYLVTGGLGALGLEVAGWLAARGARRLLLTGRTALPPRGSWDAEPDEAVRGRIEAVRRLEALGVTVRTLAFDIADHQAAAAALDTDALGLPPVAGVVHAAGVLDDRTLVDLDEESLARVLRPKADGALVLDALYPPGSLDFLALFSSVGFQLGLMGQSSYAAANAALDALARRRRALGDTAVTSWAWTSWRGAGMAVSAFVDAELADRGVGDVRTEDALRAWEHASRYGEEYVAVLPVVGRTSLPVLRELAAPEGAEDEAAEDDDVAGQLAGLDPDALRTLLLAEVGKQIQAELGIPAERLDVHRPLTELGLDSVMTQVVRRGLERRLRLSLPATLVWKHPTASAVAGFLAQLLKPSEESTDSTDSTERTRTDAA